MGTKIEQIVTNSGVEIKLENLPAELAGLPRFFACKADKKPRVKEWQKPENQKPMGEVNSEFKGFCIGEEGAQPAILFLDFDKVLTAAGEFVNEEAQYWYEYIRGQFGADSFCERSIGGHGLHIPALPTEGKFPKISAGTKGTLHFGGGAKLEIFYKTGRFCLVTGALFHCSAPAQIPKGEAVDAVLATLLDKIRGLANLGEYEDAADTDPRPTRAKSPAEQEYDLFRARRMLSVIDCAKLDYTDWFSVVSSCKQIGLTFEEIDAWNKTDGARYDLKGNLATFNSQHAESFGIANLYRKAQRFGYSAKESREEYKKLGKTPPPLPPLKERIAYFLAKPKSPHRDEKIFAIIRSDCKWNYNKDGYKTTIKSTVANLELIFDNDPNNLRGLVGYNQFADANCLLAQPPWKHSETGEQWTDSDDSQLRVYLRRHYGEVKGESLIRDILTEYAQKNAFHPVINFFKSLPPWDNTTRAETLFIKFLRVDDTPFAREVTLNWLIGAVARIFHPGCRYQTSLVLHGAQKIGKSFTIESLGGEWYMELTDNVDDPHASDAIKQGWIVELKEMSATRKSDVNAVKAFLERASETRRAAYDRRAKTVYRHCVFAITVNDSEFLVDKTGNRRYLILHCNSKMFDYVEGLTADYIRQLWAEVYYKFNEMFKQGGFDESKLSLSKAAERHAEEVASHYLQDDGLVTEITGFVDTKILPPVIWELMSREERRNFIAERRFVIAERDLIPRFENRKAALSPDLRDSFEPYINLKDPNKVRHCNKKDPKTLENVAALCFYGSVYRQHICAAEIFNECFGNDRRKSMRRIGEVLERLDGWHLGARLRNQDSAYPDQTKPYYRNADPVDTAPDEKQEGDSFFQGTVIDPDDTP